MDHDETCHHPPVSSFQFVGPDAAYTYYGYSEFGVAFGYNRMFLNSGGMRVVEFPDVDFYCGCLGSRVAFGYNRMFLNSGGMRLVEFPDGGKIAISFPENVIKNVFWGDMYHEEFRVVKL
ncbi:hypothetical protein T484DRAFT_1826375 [Baffinella frigidus]|nr:hypothetical protein T484DRAFT_1826375 [Cryptophyta sp. CCMP2293]